MVETAKSIPDIKVIGRPFLLGMAITSDKFNVYGLESFFKK